MDRVVVDILPGVNARGFQSIQTTKDKSTSGAIPVWQGVAMEKRLAQEQQKSASIRFISWCNSSRVEVR